MKSMEFKPSYSRTSENVTATMFASFTNTQHNTKPDCKSDQWLNWQG